MVKYEDIVQRPVGTLDWMSTFLGLPAAGPHQLQYHSQPQRWFGVASVEEEEPHSIRRESAAPVQAPPRAALPSMALPSWHSFPACARSWALAERAAWSDRHHRQRRAWQVNQPLFNSTGAWRGKLPVSGCRYIHRELCGFMAVLGYSAACSQDWR